ncbi:hypothetical protein [Enterovirga rhinocerotis]|nr:hypothetical protein [Enterovirga rhinocerotis]
MNILKLAGLSAVLAAMFVIAIEASKAESLGAGRIAQVRAEPLATTAPHSEPKAGTAVADAAGDCRAQAWPYLDRGCTATAEEPSRKPVRTIAIERRDTSDLVRVPFHPGR